MPYAPSAPAPKLAESSSRRLHGTAGRLWPRAGNEEVAFAVYSTCMEVSEAGLYELQVVAPAGFMLQIDDARVLSEHDAKLDLAYRTRVQLAVGRHRYMLRVDQPMEATATWRRFGSAVSEYTPGVGLHYIGEPGAEAVFLPPEGC